jgi:5-methylcytosine-specific restriction endonuclease McrA
MSFPKMMCVTKIIWGIDIPVSVTTFRGWDKNTDDYVYESCICHKTFSFELCEVCGEQVTGERLKNGLTSCSPECGTRKWDNRHGRIIARERERKGERPSRFREIIQSECFRRDNHTCRSCKKSQEELFRLMESEAGTGEQSSDRVRRSDYVLNAHHIQSVKSGGDNTLDNLVTLCGKCHKKEHSREANIRRKHLSLEFFGVRPRDPVSEEG